MLPARMCSPASCGSITIMFTCPPSSAAREVSSDRHSIARAPCAGAGSREYGRKVRIIVPQRGNKKGMMELAHRNASLTYRTRFDTDATANAAEIVRLAKPAAFLPKGASCADAYVPIQGAGVGTISVQSLDPASEAPSAS